MACAFCPAGVETLLEDTIAADPEWAKLAGVPQFMDTGPATWADVQTQWQSATDEFKVCRSYRSLS